MNHVNSLDIAVDVNDEGTEMIMRMPALEELTRSSHTVVDTISTSTVVVSIGLHSASGEVFYFRTRNLAYSSVISQTYDPVLSYVCVHTYLYV